MTLNLKLTFISIFLPIFILNHDVDKVPFSLEFPGFTGSCNESFYRDCYVLSLWTGRHFKKMWPIVFTDNHWQVCVIKEDSINGTGILNKTTISLENEFEGVKQTIHDINVKDSTQTRSSF